MLDAQDIKRLSVAERLVLVEDIWDSIARDQAQVPVPPEIQQELSRRVAEHRTDPDNVIPWSSVKSDLERRPR